MTENTFVELSKKDEANYRYDTFTLYFADKSGKRLLKEMRNVCYRRTLSKERVVLEQLAKGPMVKGHYPTIPQETEILAEAKKWLDVYFSGEEPKFTPPLHPDGSTFRQAVWKILLQIPDH